MQSMLPTMPILHKLICQGEDKPFTEPQHVFMYMIRLAQPIMTAYQSDLYWDAMFLQEHLSHIEPGRRVVFHWFLSDSHTWIMLDPVTDFYGGETDLHFRMTVELAAGGWWTLTVEGVVTDRPRITSRVCRTCGEGGHQIGGQCMLCATRPSTVGK